MSNFLVKKISASGGKILIEVSVSKQKLSKYC
jgi:hypothetical protein